MPSAEVGTGEQEQERWQLPGERGLGFPRLGLLVRHVKPSGP